ncbi:MFS transporter [Tautonia plasticadhaerens]|uniref:Putative sulfoacetate transporter SauU n=1 Tax=Tautonia plasticadhaerens TaxID=2527974 RepID=A0A518H369_9BACT|nr:MFS transporter [Tautonia plasticadhaerens]QDV35289.1 putative sulfoacetate transporter SauU [Tautonia plasticadhaerens]
MLLALALAAIISYLTRVCLAPAASTIQGEMGLDDLQMGNVLGGFFLGYLWAQVPGGWLGDRIGARRGLAVLSLLWSVATIGSALADSAQALWWTRVAAGVAQGGLFPISVKVITAWFPVERRGIAGAVPTACMSVGAALASGVTVILIPEIGWRWVFVAFSALGIAWAVAFLLWFRDRPEDHPGTNREELLLIRGDWKVEPGRELIGDDEPPPDPVGRKPGGPIPSTFEAMWSMLLSPNMWAFCGQGFFRAFGYAFFVTWFPAYLERARGLRLEDAGLLTMGPLIGVVVGSFLGGWLVDAILARTRSAWLSRSGLSAAALLVCSLANLAAAFVTDPIAAVALITGGTLFFGLTGPATWAAAMDISGGRGALVFAIMNMCGNIGAIACPVVVGLLFEAISSTGAPWELVLYLFAGVYLAGGLCWLGLDPNRSVVDRRKPAPSPAP